RASARPLSASNAGAKSSVFRTSDRTTARPKRRAAASASLIYSTAFGLAASPAPLFSSPPLGLPASAKIATVWRLGSRSRKISSRLLATSVCWSDKPVMFPPGRASDATRPVPTGSPAAANTIGIVVTARFTAAAVVFAEGTNKTDLKPGEFGGDFGDALATPVCPAVLNRHRLTFDPSEFAQSLHKSGYPLISG